MYNIDEVLNCPFENQIIKKCKNNQKEIYQNVSSAHLWVLDYTCLISSCISLCFPNFLEGIYFLKCEKPVTNQGLFISHAKFKSIFIRVFGYQWIGNCYSRLVSLFHKIL